MNAASPAVRDAHSHTWFDYDISAGISFPGAYTNTDFDNRGSINDGSAAQRVSDFRDINFGGVLQFGPLGVAVTADEQAFSLSSTNTDLDIWRIKALASYGFLHNQFVVGAGLRVASMQVWTGTFANELLFQKQRLLLSSVGASPEFGALFMPDGMPFRIGATMRGEVSGDVFGVDSDGFLHPRGAASVDGYTTPESVVLPWEGEVGFAYQLGPRPLNPGWRDPSHDIERLRTRIESARRAREERRSAELSGLAEPARGQRERELLSQEAVVRRIEDNHLDEESQRMDATRLARYENWPREKILILGSLLVTGKSVNAVSLEGFLSHQQEVVGQSISYTPRLGLEGEPIHDRLMVRAGTYIEPSRYESGTARQHFTFGGDVKLWPFNFWGLIRENIWKASVFVDVAPRYSNGGIAFGVWR